MRNVHIVSHTHWDREWYRTFQEFRLRLVKLVDGLLDLLESDKNFKYFLLDGQTIILDDYLAIRPEKEKTIREYVQKGRLIIGPWHILPDTFLVGPESHIRNLLQGNETAHKFGKKMLIGYIPDPFGHPGQVPQILRGFGIDTACLWRGLDEQPAEFLWQSPNGSQVLMAYLRDSYSNGASLSADDPQAFTKGVMDAADSLSPFSQTENILIMFGTDHMEPPRSTSNAINYAKKSIKDVRIFHSTLPDYVSAIQKEIKRKNINLPVVKGELRACKRMHLLPGVLSTRMWIKQRNNYCENLLTKWVEPFTIFQERISSSDSPLPISNKYEIIRTAWRLLMENHPHDSICGCSIDQVHDEMKVRFDQVDQIGEEITQQALTGLASSVNTISSIPGVFSSVVVFNPLSHTRTDSIRVSLKLPPDVESFDLIDESGTIHPYQTYGLGSREIINAVFTQNELQTTFGFIQDGVAAGMTIQDVNISREENQVNIETVMADGGKPNLAAWKAGLEEIDKYFSDRSIITYNVKARYNEITELETIVQDVPALGIKTLWLKKRDKENTQAIKFNPLMKVFLPLARLPFLQNIFSGDKKKSNIKHIENAYFKIVASRDGTITAQDKRTGIIYQGLNRFIDGGDCGDEYNYCPPDKDTLVSPKLIRVKHISSNTKQILEFELQLKAPVSLTSNRKSRSNKTITIPIKSTISLLEGVPRIDIVTSVDNQARDHRLRVHFPAPLKTYSAFHDGHFEVVERKIGIPPFDDSWVEQPRPEVPQRAFSDISNGLVGLMIANRGLPEVEALNNSDNMSEIALTLLRCVGWLSRDDFSTRKGHAGPAYETPGAQEPGKSEFYYSIIPHEGTWENASSQAHDFETPLRAVEGGISPGIIPSINSFAEIEPKDYILSAVIQSQDGRGWIVRGYNQSDQEIFVSIKPWKRYSKVEKINLAEEKGSSLKPDKFGKVSFKVGNKEIASILFRD